MPRNGAGTFSRDNGVNTGSSTWQNDRDAGANILALRHDNHDQDIADALTESIARDGQTTITANLPMAGFKHTNVGDSAARTDYAKTSQVQDNFYNYVGALSGTSTAYNASLSPAPSALVGGMRITARAQTDSGASATLNLNSLGAKPIHKYNGTVTAAGDLQSGYTHEFVYDANFSGGRWILMNPGGPTVRKIQYTTGFTNNNFVRFDSSGNLVEVTPANTRTAIGAAASGSNSDITALNTCALVSNSGAIQTLGTASAHDIVLRTNATSRWNVLGSSGHLVPNTNNVYDLGSTSFGVRNIYVNTGIQWQGTAQTWDRTTFTWTPLTSLSPAAATASDCANAINTIMNHLINVGLVDEIP